MNSYCLWKRASGILKTILLLLSLIALAVEADDKAIATIKVMVPSNVDPESVAKAWRLMQAAYGAIGIEISRIEAPLARLYLMVEQGKADAALGGIAATIEANYPDLLKIPTPISKSAYHVYGSTMGGYKGPESLKSLKVIAMLGSESLNRIFPEVDIHFVRESIQLVKMLELERADVALGLERHMTALLKENPNSGISRLDSEPLYTFYVHHFINRKHRELIPKLDAALQAILARVVDKPPESQ